MKRKAGELVDFSSSASVRKSLMSAAISVPLSGLLRLLLRRLQAHKGSKQHLRNTVISVHGSRASSLTAFPLEVAIARHGLWRLCRQDDEIRFHRGSHEVLMDDLSRSLGDRLRTELKSHTNYRSQCHIRSDAEGNHDGITHFVASGGKSTFCAKLPLRYTNRVLHTKQMALQHWTKRFVRSIGMMIAHVSSSLVRLMIDGERRMSL